MAALVVLAAGVLASVGFMQLASGTIAVTTLLLIEKPRLHRLARRLDGVGFRSGIRFAVMALVILPLLPEGPFGPQPGVPAAAAVDDGAVLLRTRLCRLCRAPARRRPPWTCLAGLLGGLISSTNVTFAFARSSRLQPENARHLAWGAVAANAMLYPRVLMATLVLGPSVFPVSPPAARRAGARRGPAPGAAGTRAGRPPSASAAPGNPLQLLPALQMAALFQGVLVGVHLLREWWGAPVFCFRPECSV